MEQQKYNKIIIGIIVLVLVGVFIYWGTKTPEESQRSSTPEENQSPVAAFAEQVDYKITGIDPGAGVMKSTEKAMEEYGLDKWELKKSSSAAMLSALQDSVSNKDPIIATVWQPHSSFAIGDIRKLEDPNNIYNDPQATKEFLEQYAPEWKDAEVSSDVLATVVYDGFQDDAPAAYSFFREFNVSASTQSEWIYEYSVNETEAEEIAESYFENNQEKIEEWTPEEEELGKNKISLGIPPWPGATVKSHVVARILQDMGYETEINEMDAGVVYTSLADEQIDVNVAGWLPTTHEDYWKKKKDQLDIAGINVTKTWLGLGVPEYVDENVQSLEDLSF